MRSLYVVMAMIAVGCGGRQAAPMPERPMSWSERIEEAEQHEAEAERHARAAERAERAPANHICGDTQLNDQLTSGTERVTTWVPCWDIEEETAIRHRRAMERELEEARKDRRMAARLASAERRHCVGISSDELEHSPFAHRRAIREVAPYREDGVVRGARIVFEPVEGLTADWMRQAIACQQARAAVMGIPPRSMADDPSLVKGARFSVEQRDGIIEVVIVSDDPATGQIALDRARDLLTEQAARR